MSRFVSAFLMLSVLGGVSCNRGRTTPCQKLISAVAEHGQQAHAAGGEATQLLQVLNQPLAADVWNLPLAGVNMQDTKKVYENTLAKAAAAVAKPNDERRATVLAAQATVVALSDIGVACSGER
jgi:hypothetical protein